MARKTMPTPTTPWMRRMNRGTKTIRAWMITRGVPRYASRQTERFRACAGTVRVLANSRLHHFGDKEFLQTKAIKPYA
jgi:hypothetical protein